jgi:hypothetical protein
MGTITRTFANNITTSGVFKPTAFNNASFDNVTAVPEGALPAGGSMVLLSTQTASGDASISFTTGIDSTYKEYMFVFNNIHAATAGTDFGFQGDTGTNTNYNQTITSTFFRAAHNEADSTAVLGYDTGFDQAQGTGFQPIATNMGDDNDMCGSGFLHLFDPSNTTFVKHFITSSNVYQESVFNNNQYIGGYFNTTSAITRIQFKMASGNIDDGTIQMFGIL